MRRPAVAQDRAHRLAPLLAPASVALVGASPKPDTVGHGMIRAATGGAYRGRLYLVNPNYREIGGTPCHPSIGALPEAVDLAVLGVANRHLEGQLGEAIAAKCGAAVIFASCYLENDRDPPLIQRLAAMAQAAGMPICGGNGMGFYNLDHGLCASGFVPPASQAPGGTTLITHSGSVYGALAYSDRRFRFNLAVSSGQELATTAADYLDYALEQGSTRVVGLFIETVRDPAAFLAALGKAEERGVPVVALKVGRTAESAALAVSHSGAVAGNDAAYRAVFERYGVVQTDTLDEFANALQLLGSERRLARGGLASVHDSGGERELLVDQAVARKVPFARIAPATAATLAARLDPGLDPVNPLDAWGTGRDYEAIFADCLVALAEDADTAVCGLFVETRSGYYLSEGYGRALLAARERTTKPVVLATNLAANGNDDLQARLARAGIPVLNGGDAALAAIRRAMDHRDSLERAPLRPPAPPKGARERWRARLETGNLDEAEGLALFADYGIPVPPFRVVEDAAAAAEAAGELGFPVALKTAMPGVLHKSDVGGVILGLGDRAAVAAAHEALARRLGPRVIVMPMAGEGVELAFGAVDDAQFGPLVVVGAGGVLIEMLDDRRYALPPFDAAEARRLLDRLRLRPLLDGRRGRPPADVDALALALARFSVMVADLGGLVREIDANPVLAGPRGAVALDALVVPKV